MIREYWGPLAKFVFQKLFLFILFKVASILWKISQYIANIACLQIFQ
jgi:hypothetical protein